MIIKVKILVFCENFMSTETFTKWRTRAVAKQSARAIKYCKHTISASKLMHDTQNNLNAYYIRQNVNANLYMYDLLLWYSFHRFICPLTIGTFIL